MGVRRDHGSGTLVERGDGRWLLRVDYAHEPLTRRRVRRSVTFTGTKAAAQRRLRELLAERDADGSISSKTTLGEWMLHWLATRFADGRISASVRARYEVIVRVHIVPTLGAVELGELRPADIAQLKARWSTRGKRGGPEPLSPATVYKQLGMLKQALAAAVKLRLIPRNPADVVTKPSVKGRREQRALTEDEIGMLLRAAAGTRYDAPIRFTLATGLRQGELLALKWSDVDPEAGFVHVCGTKTANSRRTVELSPVTVTLLKAHRQRQSRQRLRRGPTWQDNGLVFPSVRGTKWIRRMFYRDYRMVLRRSGIENLDSVTWHTLRHTAATQWLRHGADVFSVSRRLGHASTAFTMDVYGHLLRGQQQRAAEALDHLLA